ncbi:YkgJ family cysteine cluster protein [Chloroflexota bacterium]
MLDLHPYGIDYLEVKPIQAWGDADFKKLFDALASEHVAPVINGTFDDDNINKLLSISYCRQCGYCCEAMANEEGDASVIVTQKELETIAHELDTTVDELTSKLEKHPKEKDCWCIPLPCMFFKDNKCQIYDVRPYVCRTYPLTGVEHENMSYIAVSLGCDYGRDIYKRLLQDE